MLAFRGTSTFKSSVSVPMKFFWLLSLLGGAAATGVPVTRLVDDKDVVNVHLVPHTHDDVGWLKTVDEYYSGANNSIQHAAVRNIISSVVTSLQKDPARQFTYVEQAFFQRWWREQNNQTRDTTRALVKAGQLTFVNGGWCMHDEAATHYIGMVDQTTLGHRLLKEEFGEDGGVPTVGWQLDPFGHSATQAALLSADAGMDALFFGRIDYQDLKLRVNESRAEFVWRGSPSLGQDAQVLAGLTGSYGGNYGAPSGFNWDAVNGNDEPVELNPALRTYNEKARVDAFVQRAVWQANHTRGSNVMFTMGSDFNYEDAEGWFMNMDKIIAAANKDGRVRAFYSNPATYVAAKRAEVAAGYVELPLVSGPNADFFPYADGAHKFWTGYFTSRPALKRYIRANSAFLNAARQAQAIGTAAGARGAGARGGAGAAGELEAFAEAMGVAQHHDAASGTAKQHVTFDYAQRISKGQADGQRVLSSSLDALLDMDAEAAGGAWAQCRRLNESVCPLTQSIGAGGSAGSMAVAVWNQIGSPRSEIIRLPVSALAQQYRVTDAATGAVMSTQVLPVGEAVGNYERNSTDGGAATLAFQAALPAVGARVFNIQFAAANAANAAPNDAAVTTTTASSSSSSSSTVAADATFVLENDAVVLTFSNATGLLSSITNKLTAGTTAAVAQEFCYYISNTGDKEDSQPSGAYIFRPQDQICHPVFNASSAGGASVLTEVVTGPLVQEVRQRFAPWLTQTIRLEAGSRHAEFEFTVGEIPIHDPYANKTLEACLGWRQTGNCDPDGPREPKNDLSCSAQVPGPASGYCECFGGRKAVPSHCGHVPFTCVAECLIQDGKEVVTRFSTSIQSAGELLTDSNGREMLHRQRNFRPTWNLSQTEPVAGNYFPINAAAAIRDSEAQLTVLVDSSVGGASLADGQLEIMLHRRILQDDSRGVSEPLNETSCIGSYDGPDGGQHSGPGLVIRGSHRVTLEPPATAARVWRPLADRVFGRPQISFRGAGAGGAGSGAAGATNGGSALATALPPNVQLMTLQLLRPGLLLLRLAHQFGVDEDAQLSQPVSVDLATLFNATVAGFTITNATEVSLTNNQAKSEILKRRRLAAAWHPHAHAGERKPWRSLPPLDFSASTVVTLGPLEIKTFELETRSTAAVDTQRRA